MHHAEPEERHSLLRLRHTLLNENQIPQTEKFGIKLKEGVAQAGEQRGLVGARRPSDGRTDAINTEGKNAWTMTFKNCE